MKILIDISEEGYKNIKEQVYKRDYPDMETGMAIASGVLMPENSHTPPFYIIKADLNRLKDSLVNQNDILLDIQNLELHTHL